jgi:hypothetical protein
MGANALVGARLDIDEISGKSTQMFMVNAVGTVVLVRNLRKEVLKDGGNKPEGEILGRDIKLKVTTNGLLKRLDNSKNITNFNSILKRLLNENILLPINEILSQINKLTDYGYGEVPIKQTELPNYIELYDTVKLNTAMNAALLSFESYGIVFKDVYITYAEPNYEVIVKLLDDIPSEHLVNIILPVLLKFKNNYQLKNITKCCL